MSRILLVEDDAVARKATGRALATEGYDVLDARDGATALEVAARRRPDLILQDLVLPDIEGYDLVRRLRALPGIADIPIVAYSGFLTRAELGRASAAGFTDFLAKPVDPTRLLSAVRTHLPAAQDRPAPRGRGRRILLVDDEPLQLELGRVRLEAAGFTVETAADGAQALEKASLTPPDAVLSDALMPHVDGFRLCAEIRRNPRLAHVPVVLVSNAYAEDEDRELARGAGAQALCLRTPDFVEPIRVLLASLDGDLAAPAPARADELWSQQYLKRVLSQLERQAAQNLVLAQRASTHSALLSIAAGISQTVARSEGRPPPPGEILTSLLDACGVSKGALYEVDGDGPAVRVLAAAGFAAEASADVALVFGRPDLAGRAAAERRPLAVPVESEAPGNSRELLAGAGGESALLVPFVSGDRCLCVLLLVSATANLVDPDWRLFGQTMGVQIGQALALGETFSRLAVSERRQRTLMERANDAVFILGADGRFQDLNARTEDLLGRPRAEILGRSYGDFVAGDERAAALEGVRGIVAGGTARLDARRLVGRDGRAVPVELSATAVDVGERERVVLAIARDVTERQRAEMERRLLDAVGLAVGEAPDLGSALEVVLRTVGEATTGWDVGIAWVPRRDGAALEGARSWARAGKDRAAVEGFMAGASFAPGRGLPGRVWSTRRPAWVRDLSAPGGGDAVRASRAAAFGIRAGMGVPVLADGHVVAVLELLGPEVRDEDPALLGLVSTVAAQIGASIRRKQAEEELRESEERFRQLAENVSAVFWVKAAEGDRVLYANPAYEEVFGRSRRDLYLDPGSWLDAVHEEDAGRVRARAETQAAGGYDEMYRVVAADGSVRWVRDRAFPIRDERGRVFRIAGLVEDVTALKDAADGLAEKARVSAFGADVNLALTQGKDLGEILGEVTDRIVERLDAALARIWTLDPDRNVLELRAGSGDPGLRLGEPARVLVGAPGVGRIAAERKPRLTNGAQSDPDACDPEWARREGIVAYAGYPLVLEDELIGVLELHARKPLTDFTVAALGTVARTVAIGVKRKLAETGEEKMREQLLQAQKMEAVGRLAGGVAHDFNNMLTAVLGYCEILLGNLREEDPMHRDLSEIRKAGMRAASLTRQLLAFSRKQVLEPRVLDLNDIVRGMEKMLRRLIGEDIELKLALDGELGPVLADPGQVEQVLLNLVVNARDAMPRGGKLTLETANVDLDEAYACLRADVRPGRYAMLAVSDTGCGMGQEVLVHLFEPFFTTKEKGKGTGLGLSTVYGIVKQSEGHISVYSETGKGSTFKVYLPRVEAGAPTEEKRPEPRTLRGSETVLLVEDDDLVREIATRVLRANGYTVIVAQGGGEALLACERHPGKIDIVVTDVVMPLMSGRELAERLSVLRPGLKVLFMSGYTSGAIADHGVLEAGVFLLHKPFTSESLPRKLREVLDAPV